MSDFQPTVSLRPAEVITGEKLTVETRAENQGSAPQTFSSPEVSPLLHELRPVGGGPTIELSQAAFESWRSRRTAPGRGQPFDREIASGGVASLDEDLNLYSMGGIARGRYTVHTRGTLSGMGIDNSAGEVEVVTPEVNALVTAHCKYTASLTTVINRVLPDGGSALYLRDSLCGGPLEASFRLLSGMPPIGESPQLSLGLQVEPVQMLGRRWLAWLSAGQLGGAHTIGGGVSLPLPRAVTVTLSAARLLPAGYQRKSAARFLLVGEENNEAKIQLVEITATAVTVLWTAPLDASVPAKIVARHLDGRLQIVWAVTRGQGSAILVQHYDAAGQVESPQPRQLYESDSPLLALDLNPLAFEDVGQVHALFGPAEGRLRYVRIQPSSSDSPLESAFDAPTEAVSSWAITSASEGRYQAKGLRCPVLAGTASGVLVGWSSGDGWTHVSPHVSGSEQLGLLAPSDASFWAEWVEADFGVRNTSMYVPPSPPFSAPRRW